MNEHPNQRTAPIVAEAFPAFTADTAEAKLTNFDAQIGHALIANGLYDRMKDMVDEDGPAKLIEELIAVVDPILDAKFKIKFATPPAPSVADAAGASEGQAKPIYQARMGFYNWMDIDKERYDNFMLNGHPDNYRIVYTHHPLEIETMSMTVEEALQRAADLEKQGCITPTAQALLALAKAYQDTMKDKLPKA